MRRAHAFAAMIAFEMRASAPQHRTPHAPLIADNYIERGGCVALSASLPRLARLQELRVRSKIMLHDLQRFGCGACMCC